MSKIVPFVETLFSNKGKNPELWRSIMKDLNSKPDE